MTARVLESIPRGYLGTAVFQKGLFGIIILENNFVSSKRQQSCHYDPNHNTKQANKNQVGGVLLKVNKATFKNKSYSRDLF